MQERQVLICHNPHRITFAKTDMIKWSKGVKKQRKRAKTKNAFPYISQLFPRALKYNKHTVILQTKTCDKAQKRNYKQNNNKTMGYFIITDSNWAKLRNEILSLAETCHKAFEKQSRHTEWLHNGDVCRLLNISKRTLQHYRDTGVLPFTQIGHKCYYSMRMWNSCSKPKQRNQKNG